MNYAKLKSALDNMTEEELQQTATIHVVSCDEFFEVKSVLVAVESDVLDENHIYLTI